MECGDERTQALPESNEQVHRQDPVTSDDEPPSSIAVSSPPVSQSEAEEPPDDLSVDAESMLLDLPSNFTCIR